MKSEKEEKNKKTPTKLEGARQKTDLERMTSQKSAKRSGGEEAHQKAVSKQERQDGRSHTKVTSSSFGSVPTSGGRFRVRSR